MTSQIDVVVQSKQQATNGVWIFQELANHYEAMPPAHFQVLQSKLAE